MRRILTLALVAMLLVGGIAAPVAAQEDTTPTPTATPEPTPNGGSDPKGETGENTTADSSNAVPADLYVEQPRYVSEPVERTTSDGTPVYSVQGEVHELDPEGFNDSAVIRFGVREDAATLQYDKSIGRWVLDPQGTAGTYRVFWVVREGGDTQTYAATIRVTTASYEHVDPDRFATLQEQADRWDWVRGQFTSAGIIGREAGYEQAQNAIEDAVTWYKFYLNPLQALKGDFTAIAILIGTSPAGWMLIATVLAVFFVTHRRLARQNRTMKRQFADMEDIDESERRAWEREMKQFVSKQTGEDLGVTASEWQAVREHFDISNPRQFLERLREWGDEKRWLGIILGAYEQLGHAVKVKRTDRGDVVSAELVDRAPATDGGTSTLPGGDDERVSYVAPTNADEGVLSAMDWSEIDAGVLWDENVDASALDLPIANEADADGDLVDAYDIPIGEDGAEYHILERREDFAHVLTTLMENIAASNYTDDEGRPRPEVDMVEFLYTFASVGAEKYRLSLWDVRDVILRTRQLLDPDERMSNLSDDSKGGDL